MSDSPDFNLFISWSGQRSKQIALAIKEWIPNITDGINPWMSADDIAKGSSWKTEIQKQLATCDAGIIVLTPENKDAPWVLFESGAIYKALETSRTCTLLCDLSPPLTGPLGEFQATQLNRDDVLQLILDLCDHLEPDCDLDRVRRRFEKFWGDLDEAVKSIQPLQSGTSPAQKSPELEMYSEILTSIRSLGRRQDQMAQQIQGIRNSLIHSNPALFDVDPHNHPKIFWMDKASDIVRDLPESDRFSLHQQIAEKVAGYPLAPGETVEDYVLSIGRFRLFADIHMSRNRSIEVRVTDMTHRQTLDS